MRNQREIRIKPIKKDEELIFSDDKGRGQSKRRLAFGLVLAMLTFALLAALVGRYAWHHSRLFVDESLQAVRLLEGVASQPSQPASQLPPQEGLRGGADHLMAARQALAALRPLASPVVSLSPLLSKLPLLGQPISEGVALWNFANASTLLGEHLLAAANLGVDSLQSEGALEELLATLPTMQPHLEGAAGELAQAQEARAKVADLSWLPATWATSTQTVLARWDAAVPLLQQMLPVGDKMVRTLPTLLGRERPMTYLVLIQTNDELRATGGFITGVGTIEVEKGAVTAFRVGKVTDAEPEQEWRLQEPVSGKWVQPPAPLTRYMGLGNWAFRDVNWMADFPTTAQEAARFWQAEKGSQVDGVIALGEAGLEALLAGLGPVSLANGEEVSAQTLKESTLARVYQGDKDQWAEQQAQFSKELAQAMLEVIQSSWADQLPPLMAPLREAFTKRQILISSFDADVAQLLRQLGVDGALESSQGDYLYLVEQNVSYNKLSPFIEQQLHYMVQLDSNAQPVESTLMIHETNRYQAGAGWAGYPESYYMGGRWNMSSRRLEMWEGYYGGYTTLYLPQNSQILEATGFDEVLPTSREGEHIGIGGYVALWPQNERHLQYRWRHEPKRQPAGEYQLFVQYQPGASAHYLTVSVYLPMGYQVAESFPAPTNIDGQLVTWHLILDRDQSLTLRLKPEAFDTNPPTRQPSEQLLAEAAPATPIVAAGSQQPQRLLIPTIAVDAPIIPVSLEPSGIMGSPAEAQLVGWYELGPRPGESSNAILAGHLDWKGQSGVFNRLHELKVGDTIEVQSENGTQSRYIVEEAQTYQAATAPLADIFGPTAGSHLTLITCAGSYDSSQQLYHERLVIRARGLQTN